MDILRKREGQGMIEYILIAAFVVILAIYINAHLKQPAENSINKVENQLNQQ